MKEIRLGLYWSVDGHNAEVTKMYKNGKCQITETWVAEDTGKQCKHVENYGIGTDGNEQYAYALDYPKYRYYATAAFNWNPEMEEEEKEMTELNNGFEFEGITYKQTKPGYYFKSTGTVDKKGNPMMKRIAKSVYEQAWDEFVKASEAEWDAEAEIEARKDLQDEQDHETEANFNGKKAGYTRKEVNEAVEKAIKKEMRKPRRSKDVAFEMDTIEGRVTLTAKQVDFIKHLPDTSFWENGIESTLWCDVLADEIGGQFADKPMTVGAMISTLREKGLVTVAKDTSRKGHPKAMQFTIIGEVIAEKLGLK